MCVAVTVCNGCRNFSDCQHSNIAPFNCQYLSHIFYSLGGDGSAFLALLCGLSVQCPFFSLCDIGASFGIFDGIRVHNRYKSFPLPHPTFFLSLLISIQLFLSPKIRKHRLTNGYVITDSVTAASPRCDCSPSNEQFPNLTKIYFLNRSKTP